MFNLSLVSQLHHIIMGNEDYYITEEGYKCFTEKYHLKGVIVVKAIVNIVPMDIIQN